jgi:hypothetical protein
VRYRTLKVDLVEHVMLVNVRWCIMIVDGPVSLLVERALDRGGVVF